MTDNTEHLDPVDTLVVGGGLAGLVAATTAAQPGHRVVLLDPRPVGGRARCDQRGDYTFNRGPRALYLGGTARPIFESLGVDTSGGSPAVPGAQGRLEGVLHLLPQGPGSLLRTSMLAMREKVRFAQLLAGLPKIKAASLAGMSFGDFLADQRLSPTAADVVRMIARVATYSGDPDQVDAEAVVTNIQLALGEGVRYLDGGFQSLVDGLQAAAQRAGVEVRSVGAASVRPATDRDDQPSVTTIDGHVINAANVVVAAGSPAAAASLLGEPVKGTEGLTAPVTAACLELGLRRPPRHRVLFGVGEPLYVSTHYPPARLAPEGRAVVHAMRNHRADETLDPVSSEPGSGRLPRRPGWPTTTWSRRGSWPRWSCPGDCRRLPEAAWPDARPWPIRADQGSCWRATGWGRRVCSPMPPRPAEPRPATGLRCGRPQWRWHEPCASRRRDL